MTVPRLLRAILSVALLLVPFVSDAEPSAREPDVLTLQTVLDSVERSFPLLKSAELEQAIAQGETLSAEGGFDVSWKTRATVMPVGYYESVRAESVVEKPTDLWGISAFAGWKLGAGDFAVYDGKVQTLEFGEARAGINVPLWRNGPIDRRRANLGRALLGNEIAKLSVAQQRIEFRRAASHRYWACVAAGRRAAIAKALLENAVARDAAIGERVERGDLAPVEQTDNARALAQRRAQLAAAERGLEQATIELSLFYRGSDGKPKVVDAAVLPKSFPEHRVADAPNERLNISNAISRRPELPKLQLQLKQNAIEVDWAKNQLALGIDLQLAGSKGFGEPIASRPDLSPGRFEASILIDVPIQTRTMRGKLESAGASGRRLELQRDYVRDRIQADVLDARSSVRRAIDRISATGEEVALAMELQRAEQERFEHGDSHLFFVNLREQQTAEAELRAVESQVDYHRAVADLEAACGG